MLTTNFGILGCWGIFDPRNKKVFVGPNKVDLDTVNTAVDKIVGHYTKPQLFDPPKLVPLIRAAKKRLDELTQGKDDSAITTAYYQARDDITDALDAVDVTVKEYQTDRVQRLGVIGKAELKLLKDTKLELSNVRNNISLVSKPALVAARSLLDKVTAEFSKSKYRANNLDKLVREAVMTKAEVDALQRELPKSFLALQELITRNSATSFGELLESFAQSSFACLYPKTLELMVLGACFPISTAGVERAFSLLKLVKTRLRMMLTDDHLDDIMLFAIEGPDVGRFTGLPHDFLQEFMELFAAETKRNRRLSVLPLEEYLRFKQAMEPQALNLLESRLAKLK